MVPGFEIEDLNKLGKLIAEFERFKLEEMTPEDFDLVDLFQECEQTFFRVRGLSDFWNRQASVDFAQHVVDMVVGAHSQQQAELTLIMLGNAHKLSIFLSLGSEKATRTILEGIFPGIQLEKVEIREVVDQLPLHFISKGCITGVPSRKGSGMERRDERSEPQQADIPGKQDQAQLERVIRGMCGATWGYMIQAYPRPRQKVVADRMRVIDLLTQVTSRSRMQWQSTKQDNQQLTTIESGGQTESYSADMVNYRAQYLTRLLERELERLDRAAAGGQWTVRAYYGASDIDDTQRLASLLLGTLAGPDSRPEPLRASLCQPKGVPLETFHTFLTSDEVATLVRLPREETPGYTLRDYVSFDVDFISQDTMELPLGRIQQNGRDTHDTFNISVDALTKHVVVIGVTGSGKTTTVMNLLDRVVDAGKPFLVIEPAKTEYRSLHSALAPRADLRVYTLGNEMIAPFRLNPFEFETNDEPGSVSLLAHIDFLKAVFNAAFVLYSPMPHVLEEALHEVYEDKGWDLTSGINRRVEDWSLRHRYPIFPTLTDLYYKVEEVTNRLGYDEEVESNIKAGLKGRIGSLRIGSKGLMLDTARGISMQELFSTPTILELENIGNDDEKTFLMGLLLARLYEYRRLQAATAQVSPGLQHLIVFEEAHRLLKNTETQVDSESSNMRGQAIEVFTNMLSEVRAYGQGVLVAEQIPSKLAPDVLKNTNLKIVHRLIAQDDRLSIGQTMNLNEEQQRHLGILMPGMAAVFAEGADHAYLVRVENYKRKITPMTEAALKLRSHQYATVKPFQAIPDMEKYDIPFSPVGGPDPAIYHAAGKLLATEKSKWLWSSILLRLLSNPGRVFDMLIRFSEIAEAELSYLSDDQHYALLRMAIVRGGAQIMYERGAQFGWTYEQVEKMQTLLIKGLLALARSYDQVYDKTKPIERRGTQSFQKEMDEAAAAFRSFIDAYESLTERKQGPFAGCIHCPSKCLYRREVHTLLSSKDEEWIGDELADTSYETLEERYTAVAEAATATVQNWLEEEPDSTIPEFILSSIGFCAVLHAVAQADFSEYEQAVVADNLKNELLDSKEGEGFHG